MLHLNAFNLNIYSNIVQAKRNICRQHRSHGYNLANPDLNTGSRNHSECQEPVILKYGVLGVRLLSVFVVLRKAIKEKQASTIVTISQKETKIITEK